jgi:hypothetical protein
MVLPHDNTNETPTAPDGGVGPVFDVNANGLGRPKMGGEAYSQELSRLRYRATRRLRLLSRPRSRHFRLVTA